MHLQELHVLLSSSGENPISQRHLALSPCATHIWLQPGDAVSPQGPTKRKLCFCSIHLVHLGYNGR